MSADPNLSSLSRRWLHKTSSKRDKERLVTRLDILLEEMVYYKCVWGTPSLMTRSDAEPKGVSPKNTRIGQVHHLLVTRQCGRCGIDVLIGTLANDGSSSWVVISRGVDSCVTERSTECTQWMHAYTSAGVTAVWSTRRPVVDITRRPLKRSISQQSG